MIRCGTGHYATLATPMSAGKLFADANCLTAISRAPGRTAFTSALRWPPVLCRGRLLVLLMTSSPVPTCNRSVDLCPDADPHGSMACIAVSTALILDGQPGNLNTCAICSEAFAAWIPPIGVPFSYGVAISYVLVDTLDKGLAAYREAQAELGGSAVSAEVNVGG